MSVKKVFDVMWTCGTVLPPQIGPQRFLKALGALSHQGKRTFFVCLGFYFHRERNFIFQVILGHTADAGVRTRRFHRFQSYR